jgi:hypothetical protein
LLDVYLEFLRVVPLPGLDAMRFNSSPGDLIVSRSFLLGTPNSSLGSFTLIKRNENSVSETLALPE